MIKGMEKANVETYGGFEQQAMEEISTLYRVLGLGDADPFSKWPRVKILEQLPAFGLDRVGMYASYATHKRMQQAGSARLLPGRR
jgi:hypothetical protein